MNLSQLRTLLWLRWRLTDNQWRRGGPLNAVVMLIVVVAGLGLAVVGGFAGVAGGILVLSDSPPRVGMFVWDGLIALFLFMWMIGLISELQRSEIIDLNRLLHLPVSLRDVFLLNYFASHMSFSIAMMLPAMLGLTVGLVLGRGPAMLLLLPLVFGFFFMITAWTYRLRGWLASLMVNKRRRQAVVMGITFAFILLFQLPNLVTNVWFRNGHARPPQTEAEMQTYVAERAEERERMAVVVDLTHRFVPLLWLPHGARSLTEGRVAPALWAACGMIVIGAWGLAGAYRATVRFYQGGETARPAPAPATVESPRFDRIILLERRLPAIPEEAAAMAMASLRSMSRAPEVKMALAANVVIFVLVGASMCLQRPGSLPDGARPLLASGAVAVTFMGLVQVMLNHFGFDRNGFRALVLLPSPRRDILLGKNLALAAVALVVFAVYLLIATALARLQVLDVLAAGFEFVAAFLVMSVVGNLASILVCYRIAAGSTKPNKISVLTGLLIFVTYSLSMLAILPVFLPPILGTLSNLFGGLNGAAVTLLIAVLLAALAALLYWRTLGPLARLLERREQKILEIVTQEVE